MKTKLENLDLKNLKAVGGDLVLRSITPLPWPEDGLEMSCLSAVENATAAELNADDYAYARHCANKFHALVEALEEARYLIAQIGTTGVERTDVIRKADEWLKQEHLNATTNNQLTTLIK